MVRSEWGKSMEHRPQIPLSLRPILVIHGLKLRNVMQPNYYVVFCISHVEGYGGAIFLDLIEFFVQGPR